MGLFEEIGTFTDQALKKYEKAGKKAGIQHFVKGTFLEPYMRRNLKDFYIQLKYICEYSDRNFILRSKPDYKEIELVHRRGQILLKILFNLFLHQQKHPPVNNPFFIWDNYKVDFSIEEYIDIIISEISSLLEYYLSCLKNNVVLNCADLSCDLGLDFIVPQIDKVKNLRKLYHVLSCISYCQYGTCPNSLFPYHLDKIRNAVFHMDYQITTKTPFLQNGDLH